jgi:lipopolysaccharide export system protein LptA
VKTCCSKRNVKRTVLLLSALLALIAAPCGPGLAKDQTAKGPEAADGEKMIRVTADRLVTNSESQNAEFIGNVYAIRENMTIRCDSLKIFYTDASVQGAQSQPGEGSIRRIVADGNVEINFDNQTATTQRADWSPQDQTIVLSGPGSKIVSGKNSITGAKITLHQENNRIQVESGSDGRVEAQFYSNEQGLPLQQ